MFERAAEADEPVNMNFIKKHAQELIASGVKDRPAARLFSNPYVPCRGILFIVHHLSHTIFFVGLFTVLATMEAWSMKWLGRVSGRIRLV